MLDVTTLYSQIDRLGQTVPSKPALICDSEQLSYGELRARVAAVAAGLGARGLKYGERVCVETNEPIDHIVGCIGAMAAGLVAVPVPNNSASSYAEIVADCQPKMILASGTSQTDQPLDISIPRLGIRGLCSEVVAAESLSRTSEPEEIAMIYYTSGTTSGVRKGVLQSYRALAVTASYIVDVMKLTTEAREFVASSHDNAFWFGRVRVLLGLGATAVVHKGTLNPFKMVSAILRLDCNGLSGDTSIYLVLLRHMRERLHEIAPKLKWVKIASQAMPLEDKKLMADLFPEARIIMGYGLTEAMRCTLLIFGEPWEKLESVGLPRGNTRIRVVDADGKEVSAGSQGEIQAAGDNLATGYLNKDDLWRERFSGGWYRTGDLGYVDADGFLYFSGRIDEAVNIGGQTVSPIEVEERLAQVMQGQSYAVCGLPDPAGVMGDILALCVEGLWDEELSWCDFRVGLFEELPPRLVPAEAYVVDILPRTSNGKIQRTELRRVIEKGAAKKL